MSTREKFAVYGNAVIFQGLWFAAVLGAKHSLNWPAVALLAVLLCWAVLTSGELRADFRMALVGVLIAFTVEPIWIGQGLITYPQQPEAYFPPLWIVALWVGFAVCFNYSLGWLKKHFLLGFALGGIGSVCSITAALRLGAIEMPMGWTPFVIQYGMIWAIIVPLLSWYSARAGIQPTLKEQA